MAQALTFISATGVIWEEDWVVGQVARSDGSCMWLFARAKKATAGSYRVGHPGVIPSCSESQRRVGPPPCSEFDATVSATAIR